MQWWIHGRGNSGTVPPKQEKKNRKRKEKKKKSKHKNNLLLNKKKNFSKPPPQKQKKNFLLDPPLTCVYVPSIINVYLTTAYSPNYTYSDSEEWTRVKVAKRGRELSRTLPKQLPHIVIPPTIPAPKLADLRNMIPFLEPKYHKFYRELCGEKK